MIEQASATISRDGLSLPDLVADGRSGTYSVRSGFALPAGVWRRSYATSPYVHGRLLTGAVLEQTEIPLPIRVDANTAAVLAQRVKALINAISQFTYTLTLDLDGEVTSWTCEPADYTPGGDTYFKGHYAGYRQHVGLTIPVYPIPGSP